MQVIQDFVRAVRMVRNLSTIGEREPVEVLFQAPRAEDHRILLEHAETARSLAFVRSFEAAAKDARHRDCGVGVAGTIQVFVQLEGRIDMSKYREVLTRKVEKVRAGIAAADAKLANAGFLANADAEVVAGERARRSELALELELLEKNIQHISGDASSP
jgi:valyl-tRNA synthetase